MWGVWGVNAETLEPKAELRYSDYLILASRSAFLRFRIPTHLSSGLP